MDAPRMAVAASREDIREIVGQSFGKILSHIPNAAAADVAHLPQAIRVQQDPQGVRAPRHPDQSFHGIVITHSSAS